MMMGRCYDGTDWWNYKYLVHPYLQPLARMNLIQPKLMISRNTTKGQLKKRFYSHLPPISVATNLDVSW